ncbi:hypothetical protein A1OS_07100 [Enterovibrio norvegicus]|uniref:OmpA family protein n=1 Tax=Enterovibrio norvegicus TaxID=188144 RepID=UPI0002EB017A|nr:OmpA family protein [Enterovibrio norvegicus]OEE49534.1 hypothetical protein A1OS_07100 [Enterovibrio norvegicus]
MKILLFTLFAALLSGCAGKEIETFPENFAQPSDLRDLDLDGVIEDREKCADTIKGAIVNNDGCSGVKTVNERFTLNILFANGSSYIHPNYYPEVAKVADFIKRHPYTDVIIEGHASATGPADINKRLSLERAQSIKALLLSRYGIKRARIQSIGYGEDQLLDTANTPEADKRNRRVVADMRGSDKRTPLKWTIYTQLEN